MLLCCVRFKGWFLCLNNKNKLSSNLKLCSEEVKIYINRTCFIVMFLRENVSCCVWTFWVTSIYSVISLLLLEELMFVFLLQVPVYYMNASLLFGVFLFGLGMHDLGWGWWLSICFLLPLSSENTRPIMCKSISQNSLIFWSLMHLMFLDFYYSFTLSVGPVHQNLDLYITEYLLFLKIKNLTTFRTSFNTFKHKTITAANQLLN